MRHVVHLGQLPSTGTCVSHLEVRHRTLLPHYKKTCHQNGKFGLQLSSVVNPIRIRNFFPDTVQNCFGSDKNERADKLKLYFLFPILSQQLDQLSVWARPLYCSTVISLFFNLQLCYAADGGFFFLLFLYNKVPVFFFFKIFSNNMGRIWMVDVVAHWQRTRLLWQRSRVRIRHLPQ